MIYKIQRALKDIVLSCTDMPEQSICLTKAEEGQMQALPWASILPESQSLRPVWQWDQWHAGDRIIRVRHKYQAELPLKISVRRRTAEEAAGDAEKLLTALPRRLILGGALVYFTPLSVQPEFGLGAMDENSASIHIRASYGIYGHEDSDIIKKAWASVKRVE